jgi:CBS-domain-containing membrane protein
MGRRLRDAMTQEVVTVDEEASFKEIAATMAEHRVSALPVLDGEGRVAGIVSEADLLLKEEFPEGPAGGPLFQGRRQRMERAKAADDTAAELVTAPAVTVEAHDGIVTLTGQLERRSLIPIAVSLVHGIDGVVDVVDRLTFEVDDTPIMVPSDLLIDRAPGVRRRI